MANKNPQIREWSTETDNVKSHIPAIPYGNRDCTIENSQEHSSPSSLAPPLPSLDLPESEIFFKKQGGKPDCRTIVHKWYYTGKCT